MTQKVSGEVILPAELPAEKADLIVQVEDVSRADAPSVVVGEKRLSRVRLQPGAALRFEIEIPEDAVDPSRSYSVRAHVDVSGSGEVETNDLVTTQSYPVLTRGHGDSVKLQVKKV